jgi:hypothetical protein
MRDEACIVVGPARVPTPTSDLDCSTRSSVIEAMTFSISEPTLVCQLKVGANNKHRSLKHLSNAMHMSDGRSSIEDVPPRVLVASIVPVSPHAEVEFASNHTIVGLPRAASPNVACSDAPHALAETSPLHASCEGVMPLIPLEPHAHHKPMHRCME